MHCLSDNIKCLHTKDLLLFCACVIAGTILSECRDVRVLYAELKINAHACKHLEMHRRLNAISHVLSQNVPMLAELNL